MKGHDFCTNPDCPCIEVETLKGALRAFILWDDAGKNHPGAETWPLLYQALRAARHALGLGLN